VGGIMFHVEVYLDGSGCFMFKFIFFSLQGHAGEGGGGGGFMFKRTEGHRQKT
jgi:hypothetical protein